MAISRREGSVWAVLFPPGEGLAPSQAPSGTRTAPTTI